MKRLASFLLKIWAVVLIGVSVAGISVSAYENLSTTGGSTTGGGGGGSGATPSLQAVTDVGATTTKSIAALAFRATTGTAANPTYNFQDAGGDDGMFMTAAGQMAFSVNGASQLLIEGGETLSDNIFRPQTDATTDLGLQTARWQDGFFLNVTTTNATATQLTLGFGTTAEPGLRFPGSGGNFGIYMNGPTQMGLIAAGASRLLIDSGDITVNGGSSLRPLTNDSVNIGVNSARWNNAFFGGQISVIGRVSSTAGFFATQNNTADLGTTSSSFRDIYSSSTIFFVNATGTGTEFSLPNLAAPSVSGNIVCFVAANGRLGQQATNCTVSSERFKEHIESLDPKELAARVSKLRAVKYDWKPEMSSVGPLGTPTEEGFIAEEVAMIDPYLVVWEEAVNGEEKKVDESVWMKRDGKIFIPRTVDYSKISVLLIGAFQDHENRLLALEKEVGLIQRVLNWVVNILK